MQQLEMVNHMENTVKTMPVCIQRVLRAILKWLNRRFHADQAAKSRKSTKANDRHKNNCSIKGANVESSVELGHKASRVSTILETDGFDHTRLPDPLFRKICDQYHDLE